MSHAAKIAAAALRYQAGLTDGLPPELVGLSKEDQLKVLHASKKVAVIARSRAGKRE